MLSSIVHVLAIKSINPTSQIIVLKVLHHIYQLNRQSIHFYG